MPLQNAVSHGVRRCNIALHLKDDTNTCKRMPNSPTIAGFLQGNGEKLEEAETLQMCFRCLLCVRIEIDSALVYELLSNNSLFVEQLYEDKSLELHACDFIFFTNDLQIVNYYLTIHN